MNVRFRYGAVLVVLAIVLVAGPGLAEERSGGPKVGADRDASVENLLAQIEAQQAQLDAQHKEIGELKQVVATANRQDVNAARIEEMRKQIREILSEQEFREQLMPSTVQAGYDEGFFIRSSDDKFKMKFNGLLQFRWTYYASQTENRYLLPRVHRDNRTGFDVQRLRFAVSGNVYSPDLTYHIEFKADAPAQGAFVFDSGWINYRFRDEFQIRVGQFGLASSRSEDMSGAHQQFVDKSVVHAVYGLGAGIGVRLWGQAFNKRLDYYVDVVNSTSEGDNTGGGRVIGPDPAQLDNNPAVLARAVWHVLAENPGKDFIDEGDVTYHQSPAWDLGIHYAFNADQYDNPSTRIPVARIRPYLLDGGFGLVSTNGLQFHQIGLDSAFKWRGFSVTGEYIMRIVDPKRTSFGEWPYSPWFLASGDSSTTMQQGAYVQAGYFLPIPSLEKKLELVARFGGVSALSERQEGTWEYAGGVNYYINGNKVKLQADVTKIYEAPITSSYASLANVNDDALIFRVQLQVAF